MKKLRTFLLIVLLLCAAIVLTALGYYLIVTKDAVLIPQKLELSDKNVRLYDGENAPIQNLSMSSMRQTSRINDIPATTRLAFISTEDKRFLNHHGFDFIRIAKAAVKNARAHALKQGASTISQQLIKNTHLSQEKTFTRKLREWKLTRALEKRYTKDEILEKYLNVIYFGHNCFGIHSAAAFYFGKTPSELDLADSAILAGLVKSPNNYSPFKHPENCAKRKAVVLNGMLKNGLISQEERNEAIQKPLPVDNHTVSHGESYLHFVFDELSDLSERYGFTVGGDIQIYTYLDQALQAEAEEVASSHVSSDKTVIVSDTQTGGIKAYVSTVGNIARLPGSLLKPLLVYAPCLEENIVSPATPILDEKVNYSGYSPNNYDNTFHGYVSAREAVAKSLNVPAVKLLETLGVQKGVHYLKKMGLSIESDDLSLALALGGMKNGFTLQQLVTAYGTLANGGIYNGGGFIAKIVIEAQTVYERPMQRKRVFSEDTAFLMTDMLQSTAKEGTAKKLRSLPFPIAAKTGTAGTKSGNTDAYAISYTTRDIVGVWLGNANNTPIDTTGGGLPCNDLLHLNEHLYARYKANHQAIERFTPPKGVRKVALDKVSYYDTHTLSLADERAPMEYRFEEWFKKQALPLKTCDYFSNPSIASPSVSVTDGKVYITLDKSSPTFYIYKIERYDDETHTTLYVGDYIDVFIDDTVKGDKNYRYTVTPIYQSTAGKAIVLPTVNIKTPAIAESIPKNWWNN